MGRLGSGAAIEIFDTLDSTNSEARRQAAAGERGPKWIVALRQTAGYGRRASSWMQSDGDVAATLLFASNLPVERAPQYSFAGALAAYDAIWRCAPDAQVSLKWPNDVLTGDAKIAGLLLELLSQDAGPMIAFGAGVNIVSKPDVADYPTARLADFAPEVPSPPVFVKMLDGAFDKWRTELEAVGFEALRRTWKARAARLGETIRVRLPGEIAEGVFEDLDSEGRLILECNGVRRAIAAGAVLAPLLTPDTKAS